MDKELTKIIKGCQEGKGAAQKQLFEMFQRKMFGLCLRYAKDYTDAEDIAQDGFVKVFRSIGQFRFEGSFEGWMKRIMVNTALERFRKRDELYVVNDIIDYEESCDYDELLAEFSCQDLHQLIRELSPKYRMIFNLYAIEGYSHVEISKKLGISEGTSKSNLSRARTILQAKVEKMRDPVMVQKILC